MKPIATIVAALLLSTTANAEYLIARRPRLCIARQRPAQTYHPSQHASGYAIPSEWSYTTQGANAPSVVTYGHLPTVAPMDQTYNNVPQQPIPQMWMANPRAPRARMQCGPNGCRMVQGW